MCYVHLKDEQVSESGKELTAKQWIRIAEEAKEAGTLWLCVTGGEPLRHPEFETIWRELSQMGFFITLQTNASLIQGKWKKLFSKYPPKKAKVTLYGSNNEIYSSGCGVKDGFEQVDLGIKNLMELKIPIELVSTIIQQNENDLPELFRYAQSKKLFWNFTRGIKLSLRGASNEAKEVRVDLPNRISKEKQVELWNLSPMDIKRMPCTYCMDYRLGYWILHLNWHGIN